MFLLTSIVALIHLINVGSRNMYVLQIITEFKSTKILGKCYIKDTNAIPIFRTEIITDRKGLLSCA
jgi:hypothetical protein